MAAATALAHLARARTRPVGVVGLEDMCPPWGWFPIVPGNFRELPGMLGLSCSVVKVPSVFGDDLIVDRDAPSAGTWRILIWRWLPDRS
jgi:hypothetical protein